jgi:cytochrome c peroxidase
VQLLLAFLIPLLLFACAPRPEREAKGASLVAASVPLGVIALTEPELRRILTLSPLGAPPPDTTNRLESDARVTAFGKTLFYDVRLSPSGAVSCATCHDPHKGWSDGKPLSMGLGQGTKNAPTLWNVAYNRWHFWDGRADSLWAQAMGPIENPVEMGGDRLSVAHAIHSQNDLGMVYRELFGELPPLSDARRFPAQARPVTDAPEHPHHKAWLGMTEADRAAINTVFVNVAKSIAAFERTIISDRSQFDIFVEGLRENNGIKTQAMSTAAQLGLKVFVGRGQCILCHSGPNFTDREFHNLGLATDADKPVDIGRRVGVTKVLSDPFNARGSFSDDPVGAGLLKINYLITDEEQDGQFKTPTLRNVAKTGPYMHDGRFTSLEEVIRFYSELPGEPRVGHREDFLFPLALTDREVADLVAFLRALTDETRLPRLLP